MSNSITKESIIQTHKCIKEYIHRTPIFNKKQ